MTPPRRGRDSGLVRPYVVTGGRSAPSRNHFDQVTLVVAGQSGLPTGHLGPEHRRVLRLCQPGALSVAELSAHLGLPLSVLRILLADLMEGGHITTRASRAATPPLAQRLDRTLLEAVLAGLRAL